MRRVRDFEVIEAFPFGIQFEWEKDGEHTTSVLFERMGPIPSAKMLTFFRSASCFLQCIRHLAVLARRTSIKNLFVEVPLGKAC